MQMALVVGGLPLIRSGWFDHVVLIVLMGWFDLLFCFDCFVVCCSVLCKEMCVEHC